MISLCGYHLLYNIAIFSEACLQYMKERGGFLLIGGRMVSLVALTNEGQRKLIVDLLETSSSSSFNIQLPKISFLNRVST